MQKYSKEELQRADDQIEEFYKEVISKLSGTFSSPLTRPEIALLKSFILYQNNKLKGESPT